MRSKMERTRTPLDLMYRWCEQFPVPRLNVKLMAVYALRKGIVCATEREKLITKFQQLEVSVCLVMLMGFFIREKCRLLIVFFIRVKFWLLMVFFIQEKFRLLRSCFIREKCRLLMVFFYTREVPVAEELFYTRKVLVADELFLAKMRRAGIDGCWCFLLFLLCFFPVFRIRISFMQSGFGIPKMSIRIRIHGDKH